MNKVTIGAYASIPYADVDKCDIALINSEHMIEQLQFMSPTTSKKATNFSTTDISTAEYCWCKACASSKFVSTPTGSVNETLDCRAW